MIFEKYQSTGNDFLITKGPIEHPSKVAKQVCDRRFGIGADGILISYPSSQYDIRMVYYNSDGSIASMCGNGLRAFAHFVYQQGLVLKKDFVVETGAGPLEVHLKENHEIDIHLHAPRFTLTQNEYNGNQKTLAPIIINTDGEDITLYALFLGTLHGVVIVDAFSDDLINIVGRKLCHDDLFPEFINVNFVKIYDSTHIEVRTFERGAGPTLSCGTGVSASAVVTHHLNLTQNAVDVKVLGGNLHVHVAALDVILTGPTQWVAHVEFKESF